MSPFTGSLLITSYSVSYLNICQSFFVTFFRLCYSEITFTGFGGLAKPLVAGAAFLWRLARPFFGAAEH